MQNKNNKNTSNRPTKAQLQTELNKLKAQQATQQAELTAAKAALAQQAELKAQQAVRQGTKGCKWLTFVNELTGLVAAADFTAVQVPAGNLASALTDFGPMYLLQAAYTALPHGTWQYGPQGELHVLVPTATLAQLQLHVGLKPASSTKASNFVGSSFDLAYNTAHNKHFITAVNTGSLLGVGLAGVQGGKLVQGCSGKKACLALSIPTPQAAELTPQAAELT